MRIVEAWFVLLVARLVVRFARFSRLQRMMPSIPDSNIVSGDPYSPVVGQTNEAVRWARRLLPGEVKCLPRAATCTYMMRRRGLAARLVIGVRNQPFDAHAWTEVNDTVVNDDAAITDTYAVVARI